MQGFVAADVPVLRTARLTLTGPRLDLFPQITAMWADPEVTRLVGGRPVTEEEAWGKLMRIAGFWSLLGYGYWMLLETATGRYVGQCGFGEFRRALEPALGDAPEIGWAIPVHAQGKGYATEAAQACVAWGDAQWGPRRTVCIIHPDNAPSLRVAAKCGYREAYRTTYADHPTLVLER